jgi:16S rRNA (guanine527-N7)-methyltransferase
MRALEPQVVNTNAVWRAPDSDAAVAAASRYLELVHEWNARMDLTAARDADELVDLFLADAWLLAGFMQPNDAQLVRVEAKTQVSADAEQKTPASASAQPKTQVSADAEQTTLCDVGSGAGAPGLPLKLFAPHLHVTLVEPLTKRVAFLRTVLGTLNLTNIAVRRCRSSELTAHSTHIAVSRATLNPAEWLAEGGRIAREHTWVLLAKDPAPEHDAFEVDLEAHYTWPLTGTTRCALRYRPKLTLGAK